MSSFKKKTGLVGRSPSPINVSSKRNNSITSQLSINTNSFSTALKAANYKNQELLNSLLKENIFEPIADGEVSRRILEMGDHFSDKKTAGNPLGTDKDNLSKSSDTDKNRRRLFREKELRKATLFDRLVFLSLQQQVKLVRKENNNLREQNTLLATSKETNTQTIEDLVRRVAELESLISCPQDAVIQDEGLETDPEFWIKNQEFNLVAAQNQNIMSQNKEALRQLTSETLRIKQLLISARNSHF